ncbi:MAG: hypothetical protein AAGA33_07450 [Pseudomonadota bacterium]
MRLFPLVLVVLLFATLAPVQSHALTMGEFSSVCESYKGDCTRLPFLQAYVGGALDLVAMLDEETDYLETIYCRAPTEFFDVPDIIDYMLANKEAYRDRNAMLLVIRYLEEMGGCTAE